MSYLTFKTTLHRSNPAVIREFMLSDQLTVKDLLDAVTLVHEWNSPVTLELTQDNITVPETTALTAVFSTVRENPVTAAENYCVLIRREKDPWDLRLSVSPYDLPAPAGTKAQLIRIRGLAPRLTAASLTEWNTIHQQLESHGYYYNYSAGTIRMEDVRPDFRVISQRLKRSIGVKGSVPTLANIPACHLSRLLGQMSYNSLNSLFEKISGQRATNISRPILITTLEDSMDCEEFWEMILDSMSLDEYKRFREYCTSGHIASRIYSFPSLARYGLTDKHPTGPVTLPEELLDYYEAWLDTDDGTLLLHKKVRETLTACSRLYLVFPRAVWERMVNIMYPADAMKIISEGSQCWQTEYEEEEWRPVRTDTLMASRSISPADATSFYDRYSPKTDSYYYPDARAAIRIADEGLTFSAGIAPRICTTLATYRSLDYSGEVIDEEEMIRRLYVLCQTGITQGSLKLFLRQYYYSTQADRLATLLWSIIHPDLGNVRRMDTFGYTALEYKSRSSRNFFRFRKD